VHFSDFLSAFPPIKSLLLSKHAQGDQSTEQLISFLKQAVIHIFFKNDFFLLGI